MKQDIRTFAHTNEWFFSSEEEEDQITDQMTNDLGDLLTMIDGTEED